MRLHPELDSVKRAKIICGWRWLKMNTASARPSDRCGGRCLQSERPLKARNTGLQINEGYLLPERNMEMISQKPSTVAKQYPSRPSKAVIDIVCPPKKPTWNSSSL